MKWGQGWEQRVVFGLLLASPGEASILLQWHICPLGGTQSLALFLSLSLENCPAAEGHKTFACFPVKVLISCTLMLCLPYNYNLLFPLGPWQRSL